MIQNGDIFITKLERGFYGALRILKTQGKFDFSKCEFLLIATTSYIDTQKPLITDPRLTEVLIERRFYFNNMPNINIYSGEIIEKTFEYLGNVPLTPQEEKLKIRIGNGTDGGFPLYGALEKDFGFAAFSEWRWANENELVVKEYEEEQKREEEMMDDSVTEPNAMMDDDKFWTIIGLFNWEKYNSDMIVAPAIKHLSKLKAADIKQFEETMATKLYNLDTVEHAKNIGEHSYNEKDNYISVDFFLYARCMAVAKGKAFYESALNDPKKMPKEKDFEVLLSVAELAYEMKSRKEFDYTTYNSYETYSNKQGWK